ncbi:M23 family metallopeptidase [Breznakiellaceae bacterium SP9]
MSSLRICLTLSFCIFLLVSCTPRHVSDSAAKEESESVGLEQTEAAEHDEPPPPPLAIPFQLFSMPDRERRGEPFTVVAVNPGEQPVKAELVTKSGQHLCTASFFPLPLELPGVSCYAAILAIPSTVTAGTALIRACGTEFEYEIERRDFIAETLDLDRVLTDIRTVSDPQKTREAVELAALLAQSGTELYAQGTFTPPVKTQRRTSFFGDRRIYRYTDGGTDSSVHAGIDYGTGAGAEVRAGARGKVVFARSRIVTGNSVVLEHLPGVYSLHYHLSSIAVNTGDVLEQGALIGLTGATGLATGPHLHWEIRIAGENADPDSLLSRSLLDTEAIVGRIIREWVPSMNPFQ